MIICFSVVIQNKHWTELQPVKQEYVLLLFSEDFVISSAYDALL